MLRNLCPLAFAFCVAGSLQGSTITLNFEGFTDGASLTTQYAGTTFSNSVVLTSGISLNEFEFPPHSGINVVSDNGGPIQIAFATPVTNVSGYFTYAQPLNITGYDASNKLVATAGSAYSDNEALSGDAGSHANENLLLNTSSAISSITISGSSSGGSFTLDDLSFSTVPEIDAHSGAAAITLLLSALLIGRGRRRTEA